MQGQIIKSQVVRKSSLNKWYYNSLCSQKIILLLLKCIIQVQLTRHWSISVPCITTPFGLRGHKKQIWKLFAECDGGEKTELILKKINHIQEKRMVWLDWLTNQSSQLSLTKLCLQFIQRHVLAYLLMNLLQICTGSCFKHCLEERYRSKNYVKCAYTRSGDTSAVFHILLFQITVY